MKAVKDYKECLKTDPYLSFKTYCRDNSINYKKILDWMQRHGIYMRQLQDEARGEDLANGNCQPTFIQFRPQSHPVMANSALKGVSITFPNNISLTLQECTSESLISLLSLYHPEK
ncbi:hypothetical protein JCM30204_08750 [Dysgonomonas termitidis]